MSTISERIDAAWERSGDFIWKLNHLNDPSVTVEDLKSMSRFVDRAIADPEKARFRDRNVALLAALNAELVLRRKKISNAA